MVRISPLTQSRRHMRLGRIGPDIGAMPSERELGRALVVVLVVRFARVSQLAGEGPNGGAVKE